VDKKYETLICHFCFERFEIDLEIDQTFSGGNSEIIDCVLCCNPNKIDYEVYEGEVCSLAVSSGNE
jgi:hypothetical protein